MFKGVFSIFAAAALIASPFQIANAQGAPEEWLEPGTQFQYAVTNESASDENFDVNLIFLGRLRGWMLYLNDHEEEGPYVYAETPFSLFFSDCGYSREPDFADHQAIIAEFRELPAGEILAYEDSDSSVHASVSEVFDYTLPVSLGGTVIAARTVTRAYTGDDPYAYTTTVSKDGLVTLEIDWQDGSIERLVDVQPPVREQEALTFETAQRHCPAIFGDTILVDHQK
jgi:hypothetical protein